MSQKNSQTKYEETILASRRGSLLLVLFLGEQGKEPALCWRDSTKKC